METKQDVDALGKNRDKASEEQDFAKKQSQGEPAGENLNMTPYSVAKGAEDEPQQPKTDHKADDYANEEHDKAAQWEDHSAKDAEHGEN